MSNLRLVRRIHRHRLGTVDKRDSVPTPKAGIANVCVDRKLKESVMTNSNDSRGTLVRGIDQATVGAHDGINSMSDVARPAVDRLANSAHNVVDQVAGVATQAAETLGVKGDQLKTAEEKLVESAREYLREHPVASLSVAMATGYVLSRLFSSR